MLKYIDGDLIAFAKEGLFDVVAHGVNCFCTMKSGIAPQMVAAFGCNTFYLESKQYIGDINKLGSIDYQEQYLYVNGVVKRDFDYSSLEEPKSLYVVNAYTQYNYGSNHKDGVAKPIDYEALTLCMRKLKNIFTGKRFGFPKIGAGLAGGEWNIISKIIEKELHGEDVTIVNYKP